MTTELQRAGAAPRPAHGLRSIVPGLAIVGLVLLALNLVLVFAPFADWMRSSGLGFPARTASKPLLLFSGAFVLALLFGRRLIHVATRRPAGGRIARLSSSRYFALLALLSAAVYLPALAINFQHPDWTHRHISAGLNSLESFLRLFATPQADGMYRPLTFVSLWADYALFGTHLWGYHLQSIAIHLLNAVLVGLLAVRLGFGKSVARLGALLFGAASIHIEAVVWPAARFDLLAATFSLLSLILFLDFWRGERARSLLPAGLSLLAFAAAVLNKETGYSLVFIVPGLIASRRLWRMSDASNRKAFAYLAGLLATAAALFAVRWALYGGVSGYTTGSGGQSIHTAVGLKSCYLLLVNTIAGSVLGLNTAGPASLWLPLVASAFAAIAVAIAAVSAGARDPRKWVLLLLALLTAFPALSVIGWIQPSLMHTRHLYLPSVWIAIFFASLLHRRCPLLLISAFLLVQAAALGYDLYIWRDVITTADALAQQVVRDTRASGAARPSIQLIDLPEHLDGVLYFGPELRDRIQRRLPAASFDSSPASLRYQWSPATRTLTRIP